MPALSSRYTLIIPTFNRPAHLRRLIGYLAARRFEYPVRILDSSAGDALAQNEAAVDRAGMHIVHEIYDPATPVHKKIEHGLSTVQSTYCSLCADDDVLFTDQLDALLHMLDADPALAVVHGYYVNFRRDELRPGGDVEIWHTDYSSPSIVADDALKRIVQHMRNYQATFYGVHRTSTMKSIRLPLDRVRSLWAKELLASSLTLVEGGAYRVPQYYLARNTNPSIATEGWHPHQFFAIEPAELFREYAAYRTVLLEHLAADARCRATYRPDQMRRVLDLVHLKYLAPMLSPAVMDYLIRQTMASGTTSRQIIEGMWSTFAPPPAGGGGRKFGVFARIAARSRSSHAAQALKCLRRFSGLYFALRMHARYDVSPGPSRFGMTIRRRTRDGQQRRYVLPRSFTEQRFADGGQVTASHIGTIIDHLDDYA